ncbi:MAG TPA: hypothetical protein VLQ45_29660, partial [Thermoanaerobaculia bacterium]|nr:hypothetical protein [Thermoanaerobaculia bacterium]
AFGNRDASAASSQGVLAAIPPAPEPLTAVSRRLRDAYVSSGRDARPTAATVGRGLGRVLAGLRSESATEVRRRMEAAEEWDLLFGEWYNLLEAAADPLEAFASYRRTVLAEFPRYEKVGLPGAVSSLLRHLSEERRPAFALECLRNGDIARLPEELAGRCIASANLAVALDPEDKTGQEAAKLVSEAARSRKVKLQPDRPLLRGVWAAARAKATLAELRLQETRDAVTALSEAEHTLFAQGFLAPALERGSNKMDHQQALAATAGGRPALLAKPYLDFFKAKRKLAWPESLHAALRFWLAFDGREEGNLSELEPTGRRGLLLALEKLSAAELAGIDRKLRQARIDRRATERWQEIQKILEKRRRNPWGRLLRVFGRS